MYSLKTIFLTLAAAAAVQACNPGQYACSGAGGAPQDGGTNIYTCNPGGAWVLSAQCGGCCETVTDLSRAYCC